MATIERPHRICPQCGSDYVAHHGRQNFCTTICKTTFHDTNAKRGKVAMAFVQTWRTGKRGATEDTSFAFTQLCKMLDTWNAQDRERGRKPELVVRGKREQCWDASDLRHD